MLSDLELARDCWELLKGDAKQRHLPKEAGEPKAAYDARVKRSSYPSFFRDGVSAFAGVLSRYQLRGVQKGLLEASQDIDGEGNSLRAWGMGVDALVLRDGGCLLMADMPRGVAESRAAERAQGRRPVFSVAERRNVLNWRLAKVGRRRIPIAVTVLEWHEVEDGDYGLKLEPRYRVMRGGDWRLLKISGGDGKGAASELQVDVVTDDEGIPQEGTFTGAKGQPLQYPPVVWYGASRDGFGEGGLPLLSLANLTLDWFREYSDLKELLHRCALPVAVVKGRRMTAPDGSPLPLMLGPNSVVEFPDSQGGLEFAEPSGGSLDKHLQHLQGIEKLIDRSTLSFLFSGGGERTATQAELESAQLQATITGMAESKSSAWESMFQLWGAFTGEAPQAGAGLDLLPGITDKPVDDNLLTLAGTLYDKGLLMRETVTHLAQKRGMLRPGVDGGKEAKQLAEEDAKNQALMNPPAPGPNDLAGAGLDAQGLPLN
ncbi:MAG: DUF4055 domain-containing protein [Cyanobacteria bacterium REEB417]|nr:DUF4055 domain-containing protein [Cyanobacteria bacterium REEB417]